MMTPCPIRFPRSIRGILIGCCIGTVTLTSACSTSEATRTDRTAQVVLEDTMAVALIPRTPVPTVAPAPRAQAVTQLVEDALRRAGNVGQSELIGRLGLPRYVATEPIHNQYELGRTDTMRTLLYPGLEAVLYKATQPARTFLIRFVLTSARYRSPEGLHVGMMQAQVLDRIGPPTNRNFVTGEHVYAEDETMPTALILTVRGGRVTKIMWEFYFS